MKAMKVFNVLLVRLKGTPALALGLVLAVACAQAARAQECTPHPGTAPPDVTAHPWTVLDQASGGNNGRVAVVVDWVLYFDNQGVPDPAIEAALDIYVGDLAADGYSYLLAAFAGTVTDLRERIRDLYYETASLDGAVLIGGGLPWARFTEEGYHPFEVYLMDLDALSADWQENPPGSGQLHTWAGDKEAEIWVSRIKADHLPEIGATEKEIVLAYLARNHQFRWNAFNPEQRALAYYSSVHPQDYGMEDPSSAMRAAFGSVELVPAAEATEEDYIARLARHGADPAPYDFSCQTPGSALRGRCPIMMLVAGPLANLVHPSNGQQFARVDGFVHKA